MQLSSVEFEGVNLFSDNYEALLIDRSTVHFSGNTSIYNSYLHGATITGSSISFSGYTLFHNNNGYYGGAITLNDVKNIIYCNHHIHQQHSHQRI